MRNKILMGHLFALVTILLWGTTFISTKVLLRSFTPIEILFFRFIMGLIVLFLIYPHRLRVTDKKQEWIFAGAGLSGITLYYLFENIALVYAPASNVGVITATAPFFTALLACRFLAGEALQKKFIVGFVLAIAGIAMISFNSATQLQINPLGDLLALAAAATWAVYAVLSKKISAFGYNAIQSTRHTFMYGLVFMLPALLFMDFRWGFERLADVLCDLEYGSQAAGRDQNQRLYLSGAGRYSHHLGPCTGRTDHNGHRLRYAADTDRSAAVGRCGNDAEKQSALQEINWKQ